MNILVTGGAGFFGINFIRHVLAQTRTGTVTSLDFAPFDYPERNRVHQVTGDIRDRAAVDRALDGVDVVVHAAAALPLYTPREIFTTDVIGTRTVLEAAHAAGISRVVHVSSTAVYGIPDHHPIAEDDRKHGVGPYGRAKVAAEAECERFRELGMVIPVVRPKSFIGPERLGVFALLYDWAYTGHGFPVLGTGTNRYQLLDVEDLARAVYLLATGDAAVVNDTFNAGADRFTTIRRDFQAVLDAAGHGKRIVSIPAAPATAVLKGLEAFGLSPLYQWVYETAGKDSFVSVSKIRDLLGFVPAYSNRDALVRNYAWYVANLDSFAQASGVSHRVPWKQGVLALAKHVF